MNEYKKTGIISDDLIKPATYRGKRILRTGFLAQDVETAARQSGYNFDGVHVPAYDNDHYSLSYTQFIMPFVKSVQEQQQIIELQEQKIESQHYEIESQQKKIKSLEEQIRIIGESVEILRKKIM